MTERRDPGPLAGRSALVTGVSRRAGIGYATARRLLGYGAHVVVHHHVPHDAGQPWGADPGGIEAVLDGLRAAGPLARPGLTAASVGQLSWANRRVRPARSGTGPDRRHSDR